jgi:O-antigen ligase
MNDSPPHLQPLTSPHGPVVPRSLGPMVRGPWSRSPSSRPTAPCPLPPVPRLLHIQPPAFGAVLVFLAAHVALAFGMRAWPVLGTLHAYGTLVVGLGLAFNVRHRAALVACAAAYIVGSEVLWRMVGAGVFWEYGKYAASVVVLAAFFRRECFHHSMLPLLYFLLLVPAAAIPLTSMPWSAARQAISFNLSGPFSLAVCAACFHGIRMSKQDMSRILMVCVGPIVAILTLAAAGAMSQAVVFAGHSMKATSGGFGPNQVAAVLGLGCFLCVLMAADRDLPVPLRILCVTLGLAFIAQSALTFSRSGVYLALGAIMVAAVFWLRNIARRLAPFGLTLVGGLVAVLAIYPSLNEITGGTMEARFSDTGTTGRVEIAQADLKVAAESPWFGVGVGMAESTRLRYTRREARSHTEYTRTFAEHGLLGIGALLALAALVAGTWRRSRRVEAKEYGIGLMAFALAFMLASGMRLALPGVLIGLAGIVFVSPPKAGEAGVWPDPRFRIRRPGKR